VDGSKDRCHGGDLLAVRVVNLEDRLSQVEDSIQSTSECLIKLTTIQEQNSKREERQADMLRNTLVAVLGTVIAAAVLFVFGIQG